MDEPKVKLHRTTAGYSKAEAKANQAEIELFVELTEITSGPLAGNASVAVTSKITTTFADWLRTLPLEIQGRIRLAIVTSLERSLQTAFIHGAFPPEATPGKVM